ncbi:MAG TPA: Stp1/IreP family PP2C-type Ser/Thr phosphatase [Phototrophicaceae bacterium]|nr:Stp1/IreP family PP2C-type Ser/Thr phosphatase [Phototrophicaceae bacterium]
MANPGPSIRLRSSARTSTGQVRENNEDNIHLWARGQYVLAVVADGMGGAAAGEEASRLAVEAIKSGLINRDSQLVEALESLGDDRVSQELRDVIQLGNDMIVEKAASSPDYRGMGTTVTLAFVRGMSAIFAHVGDSRAYLVEGDDGSITQITHDHSFVEALLAAGHITREQADEHPMRNVLYRALGQSSEVDIDLYYKRLHIGDRLVLCSDGLTRHVKPVEIARLTLENTNPDAVSQKLVDLANERGGEDNVSVIVISVEATNPTDPPKKVALIADEDETLILKNRPDIRQLPLEDSLPETTPLTTPPPSPNPTLTNDPKMLAERLSDSQRCDPEPKLDKLDYAVPIRTTMVTPEPVYEGQPAPPVLSPEKQGEGRDNLVPDQ